MCVQRSEAHRHVHAVRETTREPEAAESAAFKTCAGQHQHGVHSRAVCDAMQDNGTIVAENRPYMSTKDLNWADHACHSYEHATYNVTHVSAPDFLTGLAPQR